MPPPAATCRPVLISCLMAGRGVGERPARGVSTERRKAMQGTGATRQRKSLVRTAVVGPRPRRPIHKLPVAGRLQGPGNPAPVFCTITITILG